MAVLTRAPNRFEAALEGGPVHADVAGEVATARRLAALTLAVTTDAVFVETLRERLVSEATAMAPERAKAAPGRPARPAAPAPVVARLRRGPARVVGAGLASLVVVALVLGLAGRSAFPGQSLYPVREVLDRAAVALAGSGQSKGLTLLGQADRHIGEAIQLAGTPSTVEALVTTALDSAIGAVSQAHQVLTDDFAHSGDPESLVAVKDFTDRRLPTVDTLAAAAPEGVRATVTRLHTVLSDVRQDVLTRLAACTSCGAAGEGARVRLGLPATATTTAPATATTSVTSSASPTTSVSGTAPVSPGGTSSTVPPSGETSPGGPGRSSGGGSVGVSVPGSTVTLTLPSVTLPSVTVPSVTLPSVTVPSVTLPSLPVTTPSLPVPRATVPVPGLTLPVEGSPVRVP